MPRLSLYKPEKGHDYTFLDKTVVEMFTVGGTDVFVHKSLGLRIQVRMMPQPPSLDTMQSKKPTFRICYS